MSINPETPKLIDDYINKLPKFTQDICKRLRKLIHKADASIIEDWKWGPMLIKTV